MTKTKMQGAATETISHGAVVTRALSTFPIGANLAYFKVVHKVEFPNGATDNLRAHFGETVDCGFAIPRAIHSFADDKATKLKSIERLHVVPPGFRDAARTTGYMAAFEKFEKEFSWTGDFMDQFRSGLIDLDDIVYLDMGSHMLFDRNHEVLPVGLRFDYSNGNIRDGVYHLDKALDVLSKDPRVIPVPGRRLRGRNDAQDPVLAITDVDSCNAESGWNKTIAFNFAPTVEDMQRLWAQAQSNNSKYPSTKLREAVFELDILGLRAAGAAKYDTYYGSDERPADEGDD